MRTAEARVDGGRLALMIWLKVSFFMVFPFGRPPVFLLLSSSASRGSSLRCFLCLCIFCCFSVVPSL